MLETYKRILKYSQKEVGRNISANIAIEMTLDLIEKEDPKIMNILYHLVLCPSGLKYDNLLELCPEWREDWAENLKAKYLITEIKVSDHQVKQKAQLNIRTKSKRNSIV